MKSAMNRAESIRFLVALLVIMILAATSTPSFARKRARLPTREEIAQVWVGWSKDELYLLRLELFTNGKGIGGYTFIGEEPRAFQVSSWRYEAGRIDIDPVPPEGSPTWVRPLRGSIAGRSMNLEAAGRDWKLSFVLRREAQFEQDWIRLKQQMSSLPRQ